MQVIIFLDSTMYTGCSNLFFTWKNKNIIWKAYAIISLNKLTIIYVNKKIINNDQ